MPLSEKPTEFVVALGDSFSSGEGTSPTDGLGFFRGSDHHGWPLGLDENQAQEVDPQRNGCHRSYEAWPYKLEVPSIPGTNLAALAQARDPRVDMQMLACSGATVQNVTAGGTPQYAERTQLARGFLDSNTTLVTLTIGGNYIGFSDVINTCITAGLTAGDNQECKDIDSTGTIVASKIAALATSVRDLLTEIHGAAQNAKIVLLGYPYLFEEPQTCILVRSIDHPWLNSVARSLNAELSKAAVQAGVYVRFESPQYRFTGHNLCSASEAINRIILGWSPVTPPYFVQAPGPDLGLPICTVCPPQLIRDRSL